MYKNHIEIIFLKDEYWWGGVIDEGINMPYKNNYQLIDINECNYGNQVTSFFISSKGRYFYSEEPIKYQIIDNVLIVDSVLPIKVEEKGNLKKAYNDCAKKYFNIDGKHPDMYMFTNPQYNTWIEMNWFPTQDKILNYAKEIINNGFKPGVLMIDDGWQEDYGVWEFNSKNFPNPKEMVDELHKLGFKVMLWLVPCVSPDSYTFRSILSKNILYKEKNSSRPQIMEWWDGFSGVLDFTSPQANEWLEEKCNYLKEKYGIDGFKFDGADADFYPHNGQFYKEKARIHQAQLYCDFARKYETNEMRACFNMQGKGLAQRLTDKAHSWDNRGLNMLIPNGLAMSILGYSFCCPDMIGGGLVGDFVSNNYGQIDQQLFVRYAQIATFFPMMQFSLAPWKVLNEENLQIVKKCCEIHDNINPYIQELVKESSQSGAPILRSMAYEYPDSGYETINDQFMLGNQYLITPIVKKDCYHRNVVLPNGVWADENGTIYHGNQTIEIEVPLSRLPYFKKI